MMNGQVDEKKFKLSIYLIRPSQVALFEQTLLGDGSGALALAERFDGVFLPVSSAGGEPPWVAAVRSVLQVPTLTLVDSQSPAGLMVIRRPGGTFVVNFGHAWLKLDEEWVERDFGRRVVLNLVARDQVLEIKAEQVFAKGHLASERAPRASSVREFGVEFDRDLVGSIEGISSDPDLGNTVRGARSLRVHIPFPGELIATLDKAADLFTSTDYKKEWPEIDKISQVTDELRISTLETQLDEDFASGKAQKSITLFTPGQKRGDDGAVVEAYVFGRMKPLVKHPYLTLAAWLDILKSTNAPPSVTRAKEIPVHLLDDTGEEIGKHSVFDCFGYEVSSNTASYVLSSGIWYEVVPSFAGDTNKLVKAIESSPLTLPAWNEIDDEELYNTKCDGKNGLLNCDRQKLFYGGGMSQFEFCDLLHLRTKTLFFVKIASKSSGMSHLVEQVRRTAELLFNTDSGYRSEVEKLFKKYHPNVDRRWLRTRPKNGDWRFCLVSLGRPKEKLPFFAKCGLVKLWRDLSERGHPVSFVSV